MTRGLYPIRRNAVDGIICELYKTLAKHYSLFAIREMPNYISEVYFTIIRTAFSARLREKVNFWTDLAHKIICISTNKHCGGPAGSLIQNPKWLLSQSGGLTAVLWPCFWGAVTLLVSICPCSAYQIKFINGLLDKMNYGVAISHLETHYISCSQHYVSHCGPESMKLTFWPCRLVVAQNTW